MTTSRWRSSLGNIETALRRKLGIAGPIGLELGEPSILTPVVIADDATRPGSSSALRGRRFRAFQTFSVGTAAQGSWFLLADSPYVGTSQGRLDTYSGGVIIDRLTVTCNSVTANSVYELAVVFWATPLLLAPGLPIAVSTFNVYMVDPMRIDAEPAPLQTGFSATQNPASSGRVIWQGQLNSGPGAGQGVYDIPMGDVFLNWNSALAIGNPVAVGGAAVTVCFNISGRVF